MRLLHRYRVVRLALDPKQDEMLAYYWRLKSAKRRRVILKMAGQRDIAVLDVLTGKFV